MPTTRRSRTIASPVEDLWATIGDPYHLPRWWPRVTRVEAVDSGSFTQVMATDRGRNVRADFRLTALEEPSRIAWEQEVVGTPFERVLDYARTTITLAPDGDGATKVTIEVSQRMRGVSRLGGTMVRKAARGIINDALDGLQRLQAD